MNIILERLCYHPKGTLGKFTLDQYELYTIERPWQNNEPYESCIPEGNYICEPYSSKKYPDTFEVMDVPGRTKILFCHIGNFPDDVQGCFALGMSVMGDRVAVSNSAIAMKKFRELTKGVKQIDLTVASYYPEYP